MVLWLALVACGDPSDNKETETGSDSTTGEVPTYYADVKPLLAQHCTRCHNSDGLGVGDFTDIEQVEAMAPAIQSAILDNRMPPPASDPGCQDYTGSDNLTLSDEEKATISAWIDGDTPLGDPADEPEIPIVSDQLADPDIVLMMDQAYTPAYTDDNNPGNEYRCFILEKPDDLSSFYITGMAPIIDQAAISHHAVLFTASDEELAPYREDFEDGNGVDCIDDLNAIDGMLSAWAPGMLPIEFPEGHGVYVSEGQNIILQMHYYAGPDNVGIADQSGYAFDIAESVDTTVLMAPVGSFNFQIPANDDDYTHEESFYNSYLDLKIFGIFPHMHVLGQRFSAAVEHADGSETCLVDGDYDFDNQMTYQFTEPVAFGQGDQLRFSCNWNNSTSNPDLPVDEPQTTYYGERTDEEMCFFFSFVAVD